MNKLIQDWAPLAPQKKSTIVFKKVLPVLKFFTFDCFKGLKQKKITSKTFEGNTNDSDNEEPTVPNTSSPPKIQKNEREK